MNTGTIVLTASFLVATLALAQPAGPPPEAPPATKPAGPDETASYSLGLMLGDQMRLNGVTEVLSLDALLRGLKDSAGGKALTPADKERATHLLQAGRDVTAAHNRAAAREFLARNAKESGVTSTPSGVQYKVIAAGDPKGAAPGPDDLATVNYRGHLLDGTEFDSSAARGGPASFHLNQVIKGWGEALLLMKPGAKWQVFIPPELAYDASSPPTIPPGSLLVLEVELLKVTPPN